MKNIVKLVGVIAIVAVFGFVVASCGDDGDNNNNNNNNNNGPGSQFADAGQANPEVLAGLQAGLYAGAPADITTSSLITVISDSEGDQAQKEAFWQCVRSAVSSNAVQTEGGGSATIVLDTDISGGGGFVPDSNTDFLIMNGNAVSLYIIGKQACYISPDDGKRAFTIREGVTVILGRGITLTGNSNSSVSGDVRLVDVANNSMFVMLAGSYIEDSGTLLSGHGGAILVAQGGTFVMNGGTIKNNYSTYGSGGVYVAAGGTFIMEGTNGNDQDVFGYIQNNYTKDSNGGDNIFVTGNNSSYRGKFLLQSGMIYATTTGGDQLGSGKSITVGIYGTAEYGKYVDLEWVKTADITTTSSGLTVVKGVKAN